MYKKQATFLLLLLSVLTLLFLYGGSRLRFDYNFENFFPTGDKDLEFFLEYRKLFENDNDYLLIGIRNEEGIFEEDFLQKLEVVTQQIDSLGLSEQVLSITNLVNPVAGPFGLLQPKVVQVNAPENYHQDSLEIYENEQLVGTLVAENIPAVSILVRHEQMISKKEADLLMQQINQILGQYTFDEVHLAGKAKAQAVYIQKMQQEMLIFVSASMLLVILFLAIAYRSFWGVWVPLLVVLLTAVWIAGFMGLTGKMLDVMMVLLPTIMFVVGMSDVVHILTKYIEELRNGKSKVAALRVTFREVGLANLLTSLTTAVGFLTLLTASIPPIRDFGLYTAIGVFMAFILAFTLLPAILLLMKKPKVADRERNRLLWTNMLRRLFGWVLNHRGLIVILAASVISIAIFGISRLEINTFLLEDVRENDPLRQDFFFFDEHFGGSKSIEMAILVQDNSKGIYNKAVLQEVGKMEEHLREEFGVRNIVSPLTLAKSINKALNGGMQSYFSLPEEEAAFKRIQRMAEAIPKERQPIPLSADSLALAQSQLSSMKVGAVGRISGKMPDIGSRLTNQKVLKMEQFIEENINPELVRFRLTGTSMLIDKNANYLVNNMLQGLTIAFVVIAAIAGLLFRSLRMIIITLIPNIIPLLMVAGIMGLSGIYLKMSTSIIFTIAFGIAVDDTIHFISKFRIELGKGKSVLYALKNTFLYTGKAILITTIILAGGFLTLILSSFGGTFYTGLLVSMTLIFAVVADLLLLPVLIILFFPRTKKEVKAA
ncbi:efflux RND transporter permease subunit [Nafulsella turpanensis]|uniref:efflux RND transporter permease subunit n=1 Tax=Nafulsella turpanensis TaxID=1265690 RepID=UPI00034612F4|nr:MMPL family transporter [Nafulsella turpanensis]